jgi:hypothetical protein
MFEEGCGIEFQSVDQIPELKEEGSIWIYPKVVLDTKER